jgi:hypothetical protein
MLSELGAAVALPQGTPAAPAGVTTASDISNIAETRKAAGHPPRMALLRIFRDRLLTIDHGTIRVT